MLTLSVSEVSVCEKSFRCVERAIYIVNCLLLCSWKAYYSCTYSRMFFLTTADLWTNELILITWISSRLSVDSSQWWKASYLFAPVRKVICWLSSTWTVPLSKTLNTSFPLGVKLALPTLLYWENLYKNPKYYFNLPFKLNSKTSRIIYKQLNGVKIYFLYKVYNKTLYFCYLLVCRLYLARYCYITKTTQSYTNIIPIKLLYR